MKKVKLTQDNYALVDDEDFERVNQYRWHTSFSGNNYYAVRTQGSTYANNKKCIMMHRFIFNCPNDKIIDHINHKTLDNRKCNLRICSSQQNSRNRYSLNNCTSKYKGVYYYNVNKIYISAIYIKKKKQHLGCYKNDKDAARIYDYFANKYWQKFAYLNFPNELLSKKEFKQLYTKKERSSKYIGVSKLSDITRWQSYITINRKSKYIGSHKTEYDAAKARDKYVIKNGLQDKYKLNFRR